MTWAQGVFALCGGVLAPLTGLICAIRQKRAGKSGQKGFILGFLTVICALVAVSFVAIFLFPHYPQVPTSELIALSFTIPVLGTSIIAIQRRSVDCTQSQKSSTAAILVLVGVYLLGVVASYHLNVWPYRKTLPITAKEVRDYAWTDGFLPDFSYHLRARITPEQFDEYVRHFELASAGMRNYSGTSQKPWWNPPAGSYEVYRAEEGDWNMEAFFSEGTIWVTAGEH